MIFPHKKIKRHAEKVFDWASFFISTASSLIQVAISVGLIYVTFSVLTSPILCFFLALSTFVVLINGVYNTSAGKKPLPEKPSPKEDAHLAVLEKIYLVMMCPALVLTSATAFLGVFGTLRLLFIALSFPLYPALMLSLAGVITLSILLNNIKQVREVYERFRPHRHITDTSLATPEDSASTTDLFETRKLWSDSESSLNPKKILQVRSAPTSPRTGAGKTGGNLALDLDLQLIKPDYFSAPADGMHSP